MNEKEIQTLFSMVEENKIDFETSKNYLQRIIETIETIKDYSENVKLLKIYALSTGNLFLKNGLTPWKMAEKSISASELYLLIHSKDYEVNYNYLTVTEMIFNYEKSYQRALELYESKEEKLHNLAIQFLSHSAYYHEGLITKCEYDSYNAEYQEFMQEKNNLPGFEIL